MFYLKSRTVCVAGKNENGNEYTSALYFTLLHFHKQYFWGLALVIAFDPILLFYFMPGYENVLKIVLVIYFFNWSTAAHTFMYGSLITKGLAVAVTPQTHGI